MKRSILVLALLCCSPTLSQASGGIFNASQMLSFLCSRNTFDSDKQDCASAVQGHLFDAEAATLCQAQTFDSDKLSCVKLIADKGYESGEIAFCRSQTFDSDKRSCLSRLPGRSLVVAEPLPSCSNSKQRTRSRLIEAMRDLQSGNIPHAEEMIRRELRALDAE